MKQENPFQERKCLNMNSKNLHNNLENQLVKIGIQVAQLMNEANVFVVRNTLENSSLSNSDYVLELRPGNAHYLTQLVIQANNLTYVGLDISELMIQESTKFSTKNGLEKIATSGA